MPLAAMQYKWGVKSGEYRRIASATATASVDAADIYNIMLIIDIINIEDNQKAL